MFSFAIGFRPFLVFSQIFQAVGECNQLSSQCQQSMNSRNSIGELRKIVRGTVNVATIVDAVNFVGTRGSQLTYKDPTESKVWRVQLAKFTFSFA